MPRDNHKKFYQTKLTAESNQKPIPKLHLTANKDFEQSKNCLLSLGSYLLSNLSLDSAGDTGITHTKKAAGRCARSEPVTTGQPFDQRLKMDLQVNWRVLLRDLSQGLHSFVSDYCLFHCSQTLQRRLCIKKGYGWLFTQKFFGNLKVEIRLGGGVNKRLYITVKKQRGKCFHCSSHLFKEFKLMQALIYF